MPDPDRTTPPGPTSAALDPWLPVTECDAADAPLRRFLFGYAVAHRHLGAPAWHATGDITVLEEGRAVDAAGTVYALGRRLRTPDEITDPEGAAALRVLVLQSGSEDERTWLAARVAARELGLPPPSPLDAVRFLEANAAELALLRLRTAAAGAA
ncbi:MAG TPA: hypothetical protein VE033_03080 [Acetobacteraceae bacterium]|nr:hypothetical protein [Acetobacteraceae bacterium]